MLVIYFNDYSNITEKKKEEMDKKYDLSSLFLKGYKHDKWYKKNEGKSESQPEETFLNKWN